MVTVGCRRNRSRPNAKPTSRSASSAAWPTSIRLAESGPRRIVRAIVTVRYEPGDIAPERPDHERGDAELERLGELLAAHGSDS